MRGARRGAAIPQWTGLYSDEPAAHDRHSFYPGLLVRRDVRKRRRSPGANRGFFFMCAIFSGVGATPCFYGRPLKNRPPEGGRFSASKEPRANYLPEASFAASFALSAASLAASAALSAWFAALEAASLASFIMPSPEAVMLDAGAPAEAAAAACLAWSAAIEAVSEAILAWSAACSVAAVGAVAAACWALSEAC